MGRRGEFGIVSGFLASPVPESACALPVSMVNLLRNLLTFFVYSRFTIDHLRLFFSRTHTESPAAN